MPTDKNCKQTARKEAKEGKTYETGIGLNLNIMSTTLTASALKEIESIVPQYTALKIRIGRTETPE